MMLWVIKIGWILVQPLTAAVLRRNALGGARRGRRARDQAIRHAGDLVAADLLHGAEPLRVRGLLLLARGEAGTR